MLNSLYGVRIIENANLTIGPFEDWSGVRSVGRAMRRRKKHRQNIRLYYKPDPKVIKLPDGTLVMHPVTANALKTVISAAKDKE